MIAEIQRLTDEYHDWLREKTNLRSVDDWVEITTPYLDRHNDCIQIYAKRSNGGFILTDDGSTIDDLELSGCKLSSPKRQSLLRMTLNGFGVHNENNVLQVRASSTDFALRKHNLLQAMLAVNDLFYLATPMVASLFLKMWRLGGDFPTFVLSSMLSCRARADMIICIILSYLAQEFIQSAFC